MKIEQLTADDWQRYKKIRLISLADTPDAFGSTLMETRALRERDWRAHLRQMATFVAVANGRDIGASRGVADHINPANAYLVSMWVSADARGARVGEALIQAVVDWARCQKFERLCLDVADENASAIRLYARMGFEPNGEVGSLPAPRQHVIEHRRVLPL